MSETRKRRPGDAPCGGGAPLVGRVAVNLTVNGQPRTIAVEPRMTLLDALREELALTGTKKACDRGECGACTLHVGGRRVLSCMTLAAMQEGKRITTIEGLERDSKLHPLQAAFIEHDGFQCGFCTSGQIMSGVAMIEEAKAAGITRCPIRDVEAKAAKCPVDFELVKPEDAKAAVEELVRRGG